MKLTLGLSILIAAAIAASAFVYHHNQTLAREKAERLAKQTQTLAALDAEQQRLSSLAADATNATTPAADHQAEITKLRAETASLRRQTNQLARQSKLQTDRGTGSSSTAAADTHPPEYWEQLHKAEGTKGMDARDVATAALFFAREHGNQLPTNFAQLTKYFSKTGRTVPLTNRFEFVFSGSLDQLEGIPPGTIALVRDTQTWTAPDGKQARVYGMVPGMGQVVLSDDNFQSWEAEHVISPARK